MCLTIDGDDEAKPNIDVLDFLVLWSLLCLVFKHLSQKTIQRLDTVYFRICKVAVVFISIC